MTEEESETLLLEIPTKEETQTKNRQAQTWKATGRTKAKKDLKRTHKAPKQDGYEDEMVEYEDSEWTWEDSKTAKERLKPKNKKRRG